MRIAVIFLSVFSVFALGFGPAAAQPNTCDAPGHMLIMGGIENPAALPAEVRARAAGYGAAVRKLITGYGATYIVQSRPIRTVEGTWPAWKSVVISTWPCREAGQAFWHADAYQKDAKPLRAGAGTYRVAMYGAPPRNPMQTGQWTTDGGPLAKNVVCASPVYLLVLADARDEAKLAAYRQKLSDTAIQQAYGAEDVLAGAPAEVLEGDWPKTLTAKVTKWPCVEAFDAFYNSLSYGMDIKPLREGAAAFTAVILKPAGS